MADEAIVVAARDEATKILSGVEKQLGSLNTGIERMATATEASSSKIIARFDGIAKASIAIAAVWAAMTAATQAFNGAAGSVAAYNAQQSSIDSLAQSIRGQTDDLEASMAAHRDFAGQLQQATNIGDEQTLALMKQAAALGVQEDQLQAVAATAAGLSAEFGIGLDAALQKTMAATYGNAAALGDLIPEMKYAVTEAQRFDMVLEAAGRGLESASARTETVAGKMTRSANALGDLSEVIGSIFAPLYGVAADFTSAFAERMQTELAPAVEWITTLIADAGPIFEAMFDAANNGAVIAGVALDVFLTVLTEIANALGINSQSAEDWGQTLTDVVQWASEQIIGAMTWVEVILTNLPAVFDLVAMAFELAMVSLIADAEHAFTVALPTYLEFYTGITNEWANGLIMGLQMSAQIWLNALLMPWYTIQALLPGILDSLNAAVATATAGWGESVEFSASQIGSLPEVAARQLTARETELQTAMGKIATDLSSQFTAKFDERVARLGVKARENLVGELQQAQKQLERNLPRLGVDTTQLNAVEARFLTRGVTQDPLVGIEAHTRRTAEATERLPAELAQAIAVGLQPGPTQKLEVIR